LLIIGIAIFFVISCHSFPLRLSLRRLSALSHIGDIAIFPPLAGLSPLNCCYRHTVAGYQYIGLLSVSTLGRYRYTSTLLLCRAIIAGPLPIKPLLFTLSSTSAAIILPYRHIAVIKLLSSHTLHRLHYRWRYRFIIVNGQLGCRYRQSAATYRYRWLSSTVCRYLLVICQEQLHCHIQPYWCHTLPGCYRFQYR
jgi:hypothetical protein